MKQILRNTTPLQYSAMERQTAPHWLNRTVMQPGAEFDQSCGLRDTLAVASSLAALRNSTPFLAMKDEDF